MKQISEQTGICFFRVSDPARLSDFLLHADFAPLILQPSDELVKEWLHYGSVYVDGLRRRKDFELQRDQLIRLHTRRKSYVSRDLDLRARMIFSNDDFLVLDKPGGLPTHPTLDNYLENAKVILEEQLGHPVFVTHRLDVATSGLLILAKSLKAQAQINKLFAKRKVRKFYRARVEQTVSLGLIEHFMDPSSRIPKVLSRDAREGWLDCRMDILEANERAQGYELEIELLTGRTHQIRAQLAALGAPITGDTAYGSKVRSMDGSIELECVRLCFIFSNHSYEFEKPCSAAMS
jgi:23S rRNA pseudouridine1911/1915/1917 synthase